METNPLYSNPTWQRMYQLQLSRGFSPEIAASKASAELQFRTMQDVRAMAPAAQMDRFEETPLTPQESRRAMPAMTATIPAKPVAQMGKPEDNEEARLNQMRVINAQARAQGLDEPYPDVPAPRPIDRSAYATGLTNTLTQSLGLPSNTQSPPWPSAAAPAPAPAAAAPAPAADTAKETPVNLPMFARPNWGAQAIPENVQDRSVTPGLLAMATQRLAPYSTQVSSRFSTDKPDVAAPRAVNAGPARTAPVKPAAAQAAAPAAQSGNFFTRMFSGPDVQSTGQQVVQRMQGPMAQGQERPTARLNWGDRDSAADFFRADKARQELEKSGEAFTGMKRGGSAGGSGKDAALHKALEIIHHMLTHGR